MTSGDVNALLATRRQALARLDIAALTELYADDVVLESPAAGGTVTGRHAIGKIYRGWFEAFPDFKLEGEHFIVEGGQVAHSILTIENGRITHELRIYDFTGMPVEIAVLKAKPL